MKLIKHNRFVRTIWFKLLVIVGILLIAFCIAFCVFINRLAQGMGHATPQIMTALVNQFAGIDLNADPETRSRQTLEFLKSYRSKQTRQVDSIEERQINTHVLMP